jgi:hypothetical protein
MGLPRLSFLWVWWEDAQEETVMINTRAVMTQADLPRKKPKTLVAGRWSLVGRCKFILLFRDASKIIF